MPILKCLPSGDNGSGFKNVRLIGYAICADKKLMAKSFQREIPQKRPQTVICSLEEEAIHSVEYPVEVRVTNWKKRLNELL